MAAEALTSLHAPFTSSSAPLDGWHFPGPSSKYHQRERARSQQTRHEPTYTPQAPVLSTERRAHRRAQSYAQISCTSPPSPDLSPKPLGRFPSYASHKRAASHAPTYALSPPASEQSRSPLSRFPSYTRETIAESDNTFTFSTMAAHLPVTPAKSERPQSSMLHDSPFSDYFTDEARSTFQHTPERAAMYDEPSSEAQQLLVRLNNLQSTLMRGGSEREALNIVGRRMSLIELELNALHSQTRLPAELEDSGLFLDDDEVEMHEIDRDNTPNGYTASVLPSAGLDGAFDHRDEMELDWGRRPSQTDKLLLEARSTLDAVTKAQEQLRQRHEELRELNDNHVIQIEERDEELEKLRSENEALKSDLGFDHSELLFLKLQYKALEVDVDGAESDEDHEKQEKRGSLLDQLDRWRSDWHDVEDRFKRRRKRYGVLEKTGRGSIMENDTEVDSEERSDWELQTVKQGQGRVSSITIRRVSKTGIDWSEGEAHDEPESDSKLENSEKPVMSSTDCKTSDNESTHVSEIAKPTMADIGCQAAFETPPPSASSKPAYTDQSTQANLPPRLEEVEMELFPDTTSDDTSDRDPDECAITTSPPSDDEGEYGDDELAPMVKTAWQELCEGLANLAGVGEDRW